MKKTGNDFPWLVRPNRMNYKIFRHPIECVKGERDEEDVSHVDLPLVFATTLSHRSHRSGCVLLVPTYARWRQQRAHFFQDVFVTDALASLPCSIVRSLKMKNSSSSSLSIFEGTSEFARRTTEASSAFPINFS